jgi:hypothetical protein
MTVQQIIMKKRIDEGLFVALKNGFTYYPNNQERKEKFIKDHLDEIETDPVVLAEHMERAWK